MGGNGGRENFGGGKREWRDIRLMAGGNRRKGGVVSAKMKGQAGARAKFRAGLVRRKLR